MFHSSATKIWNTKPNLHGLFFLAVDNPTLVVDLIGSIYGIFTDILIDLMLDVGKHTIHGSYGVRVFGWLCPLSLHFLLDLLAPFPTEPPKCSTFPGPASSTKMSIWSARMTSQTWKNGFRLGRSPWENHELVVEPPQLKNTRSSNWIIPPKRDEIKNIWVATT